jgi:hypothetical protein
MLIKFCAEPWWVVEGTASISWATALPIPQRVSIIKYISSPNFCSTVTEEVVSNEWYTDTIELSKTWTTTTS